MKLLLRLHKYDYYFKKNIWSTTVREISYSLFLKTQHCERFWSNGPRHRDFANEKMVVTSWLRKITKPRRNIDNVCHRNAHLSFVHSLLKPTDRFDRYWANAVTTLLPATIYQKITIIPNESKSASTGERLTDCQMKHQLLFFAQKKNNNINI